MVWVALLPAELTLTAIMPMPPAESVPWLTSRLNPPLVPDTPPVTEMLSVYVVPGEYEAGWPLIETDAAVVPDAEWHEHPEL